MNYTSYSRLILAYSGGLDSHVLLHQLANNPNTRSKLHTVHIHHGLSPNADSWQAHCASVCKALSIPFTAIKINIDAQKGDSLEAVARKKRYAELAKFVSEDIALLTAHHQDDQAETLLLQLLRGAGVKGLAAMPEEKKIGKGVLLRPLLGATRADLLAYAQDHSLEWIEDESNQHLGFNRNFLRKTIVPLLQKRWPSLSSTLARSSRHCAEASELLNEIAELDWQLCQGKEKNRMNILALQTLSLIRQKNVLRYWVQKNQLLAPNDIHIQKIITEVMGAGVNATPLLSWSNVTIRRFKDELYVVSNAKL
jgi:tRNA(Ile)-lysidine synthase